MKASLVVCHKRITKPYKTDEPWGIEEWLVKLGADAVGYGVAVLTSIPGSLDPALAENLPMALLVAPDGKPLPPDGRPVEGAVSLRCVSRCMARLGENEPLYEKLENAIGTWAKHNRERWDLRDGSNGDGWRAVAFTSGYHASTHRDHRVKLAQWRLRLAQQSKATHEREIEQWAKKAGLETTKTKRRAYVAVTDECGYRLGIAVEGEKGYHPTKPDSDAGAPFGSYEAASAAADAYNESLGLTKAEAHAIVASSMAKGA